MIISDPALLLNTSTRAHNKVLASILLVSFNSRHYLRGCLDSLNKTLPRDCEIILFDNGSSDGSADLVIAEYPHVRLLQSPTNIGFAAGSNRAAASASGEILVFINPDTWVRQGWLESLLAPFQIDKMIGLTTSKILLMKEAEKINTCGNDIHLSGITLCRGVGLPRAAFDQPDEVSAISGAAFAIRRDLFEELGGFDEDFFLYEEDSDLSWRARLAGYRCIYTPDSIVYHDYKLRFGQRKIFYQERNRYLMLLKNLHWGSFLVLLPVLVLAEIVTWAFVLMRRRDQWTQKFEVYAWIVRHWDDIRAKRDRIQQLRLRRDRDLLLHHTWRLAYEQTGQGPAATMAHIFINPIFFGLYSLARLLIWW